MLESLYWLGGGIALLIAYVIVSNTIWLLFGSRLIQKLPGVNITGFRGTLKIALMLLMSVFGLGTWIFKYLIALLLFKKARPVISNEIAQKVKWASRVTKNKL
ncbi:hypothetical protein OAI02_01650 [Candidatus Pseudothioglobus singularis]|jgi:hypothetical protein|nr:hypothetical protein [Candidatus Pseudothioglobus singularis]MDB4847185.1 hypothetical protein [Candidatus Pseudothioglobus singularis]|tara:strand:+ start:432 stop:740 length:309 start_codon:yes stop_codon:yes gene_type:complete